MVVGHPHTFRALLKVCLSNPSPIMFESMFRVPLPVQTVEIIAPRDRDRRLEQLLKQYHSSRKNRVIVFVLYKKEAARVEQQLNRAGWKAAAVHGDASQQQRTRAVEQFKVCRDGMCTKYEEFIHQ